MKLYESGEMYLETVLLLSKDGRTVRMVDVAEKMGFSKPSVSVFLKELRGAGYLSADENGGLTLTDSGRRIAERIYDRHKTLTELLSALGVDEATAAADACKMEHDISDTTFARLKAHLLTVQAAGKAEGKQA